MMTKNYSGFKISIFLVSQPYPGQLKLFLSLIMSKYFQLSNNYHCHHLIDQCQILHTIQHLLLLLQDYCSSNNYPLYHCRLSHHLCCRIGPFKIKWSLSLPYQYSMETIYTKHFNLRWLPWDTCIHDIAMVPSIHSQCLTPMQNQKSGI